MNVGNAPNDTSESLHWNLVSSCALLLLDGSNAPQRLKRQKEEFERKPEFEMFVITGEADVTRETLQRW